MAVRSVFRTMLLPAALVSLLSSAVAVAAVKQWQANAIPVETIFESGKNTEMPFEEPGRFMVDSKGGVVVLDKKLDSVFKLDKRGKVLWRIDGTPSSPRRFKNLQDLYVDSKDRIWVLDFLNDMLCTFSPDGKFLQSFKVARYPRRFVVTSRGEVVVNAGTGGSLLDAYSPTGTYLRSFGERFKYPNDTSDFEFNSGLMAAGPRGEIYFSFSYPPVIRAYGGRGALLWEAKIPFGKPIAKPRVSVPRSSNHGFGASIQYQVASLDLAVDSEGRLLSLSAGTPEKVAFNQGSQRLDAFSPDGRHLGAVTLPVSANRMASHLSGLFLLENHKAASLTRFILQPTG